MPVEWRLETYEQIGSTSDLCMQRAAAGAAEGLAVLAFEQTQARGSRGRPWQSPLGNLSLSVLLRPGGAPGEAGQWPLLAGVALAAALAPLLPDPAILGLKWPNDVLLRQRKLGGILIDTVLAADQSMTALVIGFGVNLAVAPAVPGRTTACLAEAGIEPPGPEEFARLLLAQLGLWLQLRARDGFAAVRAAWLAYAHPLGTELTIVHGERVLSGAFAGLAEDGHLLLRAADRLHAIAAGEIIHASHP